MKILVPRLVLLSISLFSPCACQSGSSRGRPAPELASDGSGGAAPNDEATPDRADGVAPSGSAEDPLGDVPLADQKPSPAGAGATPLEPSPRSRVSLNDGWRFERGDPDGAGGLSYSQARAWVLPTGNDFLADPAQRSTRPDGNLGDGVAFIAPDFDDSAWRAIDLPHDYAIEGPYTNAISSSMGRLPSSGVAWYRRRFTVEAAGAAKSYFIDIDGAMSFSMVWVNGRFAGGWPSGYASYELDVSSLVQPGQENTLVIRVDNPVPVDANWQNGWSRWYPGAGVYRNVWLVATDHVHVARWGTHLTTPEVSPESATITLDVTVKNGSAESVSTSVATDIYELDLRGARVGAPVAGIAAVDLTIPPGSSATASTRGSLEQPKLWGPPPTQQPNRYVAITRVLRDGALLDRYETPFGVRTLQFDPNEGLLVNGQHVKLNGVCNHHDLGPLGAAFNYRARERQLELLAEMGSNAIRTAHNPFEPEFMELADRLGFLIVDEAFDVWQQPKAAFDYNVLFDDWHEQDLRALIRRDRNHPSVILWSIGNEVGEQTNPTAGPALAERLTAIMPRGRPDAPDHVGHECGRARRSVLWPDRHHRPQLSGYRRSRSRRSVSDVSPDEEFESQDKWSFVGGEFVWTGFDYLGEPTPLDSVASSSYFGILDIAGLEKDRFYLYQSYWRPEHPMAHILPHWTWPERVGQVTPVHVYTSGDSAELFVNGVSQGRKSKGQYEYRLRWDDVVYEPGELSVVAYENGAEWARDSVATAGAAAQLGLAPDRARIAADGRDLCFVTLSILDSESRLVPQATDAVTFTVAGAGELVATANGDATNRIVFSSPQRSAFSGKAVAIVRALPGQAGEIVVTATAAGLPDARLTITAE